MALPIEFGVAPLPPPLDRSWLGHTDNDSMITLVEMDNCGALQEWCRRLAIAIGHTEQEVLLATLKQSSQESLLHIAAKKGSQSILSYLLQVFFFLIFNFFFFNFFFFLDLFDPN